jgi:hypothetical protein
MGMPLVTGVLTSENGSTATVSLAAGLYCHKIEAIGTGADATAEQYF